MLNVAYRLVALGWLGRSPGDPGAGGGDRRLASWARVTPGPQSTWTTPNGRWHRSPLSRAMKLRIPVLKGAVYYQNCAWSRFGFFSFLVSQLNTVLGAPTLSNGGPSTHTPTALVSLDQQEECCRGLDQEQLSMLKAQVC